MFSDRSDAVGFIGQQDIRVPAIKGADHPGRADVRRPTAGRRAVSA